MMNFFVNPGTRDNLSSVSDQHPYHLTVVNPIHPTHAAQGSKHHGISYWGNDRGGEEDSAMSLWGVKKGVIKPQSPAQPVPFCPWSFSLRVC